MTSVNLTKMYLLYSYNPGSNLITEGGKSTTFYFHTLPSLKPDDLKCVATSNSLSFSWKYPKEGIFQDYYGINGTQILINENITYFFSYRLIQGMQSNIHL